MDEPRESTGGGEGPLDFVESTANGVKRGPTRYVVMRRVSGARLQELYEKSVSSSMGLVWEAIDTVAVPSRGRRRSAVEHVVELHCINPAQGETIELMLLDAASAARWPVTSDLPPAPEATVVVGDPVR
jgi:hypothetical protein